MCLSLGQVNKGHLQIQDCLWRRSPRHEGGLAWEMQCSAKLLPHTAGIHSPLWL